MNYPQINIHADKDIHSSNLDKVQMLSCPVIISSLNIIYTKFTFLWSTNIKIVKLLNGSL